MTAYSIGPCPVCGCNLNFDRACKDHGQWMPAFPSKTALDKVGLIGSKTIEKELLAKQKDECDQVVKDVIANTHEQIRDAFTCGYMRALEDFSQLSTEQRIKFAKGATKDYYNAL